MESNSLANTKMTLKMELGSFSLMNKMIATSRVNSKMIKWKVKAFRKHLIIFTRGPGRGAKCKEQEQFSTLMKEVVRPIATWENSRKVLSTGTDNIVGQMEPLIKESGKQDN